MRIMSTSVVIFFYDDVSGQELPAHLVRAARQEEKEGVMKHKVFDKVPIEECYANTGKNPIGTRWVGHNKGDAANPDIRCRWVGREFKGRDKDRDDLFAGTPPL